MKFNRILNQGMDQFADIDFEEIDTNQSAEENKNRWIQVRKYNNISCLKQ